jgi:hypothetical protein
MTVTTNTLSTNAKYIVYSGIGTGEAQGLLIAISNAMVSLGWTKYDSSGAGSTLGSASDAQVILRRPSSDNAQSGHYQYLTLRLVDAGTFTMTFHADQSNSSSYTSYVNSALNSSNPFTTVTSNTVTLSSGFGGTIWIFNETYSTIFKFNGDGFTEGEANTTRYFGEYRKDFGENCDVSTGYIHNGVAMDLYRMWDSNGCESNHVLNIASGASSNTYQYQGFDAPGGSFGRQFALTEWPTTTQSFTSTSLYITNSSYGVPASNVSSQERYGLVTRMNFGWIGWLGHITAAQAIAPSRAFNGSNNSSGAWIFANGQNNYPGGVGHNFKQYIPGANSNSISLYEPSFSVGTINRIPGQISNNSPNSSYNSGASLCFALLGKPYGLRISGGQPALLVGGSYSFLDTASIPLNSDGFFDLSGTPTECWAIPIYSSSSYSHSAVVWVKK